MFYQRANFATQLPAGYLYTNSHSWLARVDQTGTIDDVWRVGYTRFALRMLGELVDIQFEATPGAEVQPGDIVGAIEGFKTMSDIYCVGSGRFAGMNQGLNDSLTQIVRSPYDAGWLYEFSGSPDPRAIDVNSYRALLDATIDRILEKQQGTIS